jgi:hypothetical protein
MKKLLLALPLMIALALSPIAFGGETTTNASPNASVTTQTNAVKAKKTVTKKATTKKATTKKATTKKAESK